MNTLRNEDTIYHEDIEARINILEDELLNGHKLSSK
jgi:hypothetical protein